VVDAVVIGAGIGGLSAAIALGAAGLRVVVVEAHERAGGKAGIEVVDGIEVDTGPSVLTLPAVLDTVLARAGSSLHDELELTRPEPAFRYLFADGVALDVHHELEATLDSVAGCLGPSARDELQRFVAYAHGIWTAAAPAFVFGDAPSWLDVARGGLSMVARVARIDPLSTMWQAIARRVRSPHLRMLLARYATYNGSDVRSAPATLGCIAHVELALGGFGVRGGMYQIVRALLRAAARVGVTVECGARVERIATGIARRSVTGVVLAGGREIPARSVVANADVSHVMADLLEGSSAVALPGPPSMSGACAIVRATRRADRAAHTVIFPHDYLAEFADIFDRGRPPDEPTVYLCAQEKCHGARGWPDEEPLFMMINAPPEPLGGVCPATERAPRDAASLARAVARGVLSADDRVVWRRSPAELARRFPGSRGAIYGAASNSRSAAFKRPPNRVAAIAGLYLASGSAHPGGGIPLAALSGLAAARALLAAQPIQPSIAPEKIS
jgi:phytoene desaturase